MQNKVLRMHKAMPPRLPPALRAGQKSVADAGHAGGSPKRSSSFGISAVGQAEGGGHTTAIRRGAHRCVATKAPPAHTERVRNRATLPKGPSGEGKAVKGAGAGRRRPAVTLHVLTALPTRAWPPARLTHLGCQNLLSFFKTCSPVSCFQRRNPCQCPEQRDWHKAGPREVTRDALTGQGSSRQIFPWFRKHTTEVPSKPSTRTAPYIDGVSPGVMAGSETHLTRTGS